MSQSAWRRPNRNVYILGAGFSAPRGIPVVRNFLTTARDSQDWLHKHDFVSEVYAIDSVLQFRLEAGAAAERMHIDLENIEHLFSLASAAPSAPAVDNIILTIGGVIEYSSMTRDEPRHRIATGKHDPVKTPSGWFSIAPSSNDRRTFDIPAYDFACGVLVDAFGSRNFEDSTFITLNYDTTIERAFHRLGVNYSLCLPDAEDHRTRSTIQTEAPAKLLKLHGSVNWTRTPESTRLLVYDSYSEITKGRGLVPFLVPPTWKQKGDNSLSHLWSEAVTSIREAARIVVIGYSFPDADQDMRYLLASGLMKNSNLRSVMVWDIDSARILDRLHTIFRKELSDRGIISVASAGIVSAFDAPSTRQALGRAFREPYFDDN